MSSRKEDIIQWAKDKNLHNSTALRQSEKTQEEVDELVAAIKAGNTHEIKDAYGDIYVTLVVGALTLGIDIDECIEQAYNVIAKRTGKTVDGIFIKD